MITVSYMPPGQWSCRISNRQLASALEDSRALIAEKLILRSCFLIKLSKEINRYYYQWTCRGYSVFQQMNNCTFKISENSVDRLLNKKQWYSFLYWYDCGTFSKDWKSTFRPHNLVMHLLQCCFYLLPGAEYLARFLRIKAAVRRICLVTGPSRASCNQRVH